MNEQKIKPEKITKPIQLLAAWLIGLIVIVSALITGATLVTTPDWLPVFFSISAVGIIPLFLLLIFLLQTKYRPQMQEDQYYSQYLNRNTMEIESRMDEKLIHSITKNLKEKLIESAEIQEKQILELNKMVSTLLPKSDRIKSKKIPRTLEFSDESSTYIYLNKKLENSDNIEKLLYDLKIKTIGFFGDSPKSKTPQKFLLSFGVKVNLEILKKLTKKLINFGLTDINVFGGQNYDNTNLYIGSYAFGEIRGKIYETLKLSDEIINQIQSCKTTSEAYLLVKRNAE